MLTDREKAILELLLKDHQITVKRLSSLLYVSEPSIRRDLAKLEKQHMIKRVHGGAMIEEHPSSRDKIPFSIRELEQGRAKLVMAQKAADYIHDNDIVFLDASTSAYSIIPYLSEKRNITVVTNGISALQKLAELDIRAISTGGALVSSCKALVGEAACQTIDAINADIAFFSCRGLSKEGMLTDIAPAENFVRRHMISHAKKSYLLCAGDKFQKEYYHNLCHLDDINGLITDGNPPVLFPVSRKDS